MNEFMMLIQEVPNQNAEQESARGCANGKSGFARKKIKEKRARAQRAFRRNAGRSAAVIIQCWWRRVVARAALASRRKQHARQFFADSDARENVRNADSKAFIARSAKVYDATWKIPIDFVGYSGGARGSQYSRILGRDRGAHIVVYQSIERQDFHFLFHVSVPGLWQIEAYRTFDQMALQSALLPLFGDVANRRTGRTFQNQNSLRNWAVNGGKLDRKLL